MDATKSEAEARLRATLQCLDAAKARLGELERRHTRFAQRVEDAAEDAYQSGRLHHAYRLWKLAREDYRILGDDDGYGRCQVRSERAWRELSGEECI